MGIKLTTEVKEVIHQMIAITKEFEPGMMNTLVLFDALLLNRLFATSMEVSSSCKLELISGFLETATAKMQMRRETRQKKIALMLYFLRNMKQRLRKILLKVKHTKKMTFISLPRALLMHVEQIVEVLIFHRIWQMFLTMQFRL